MKNIFNNYYTSQGIPFKNLSKTVTFPDDSSLPIYSYVYNDQDIAWTIMSYKLYGTIQYWWVLTALNISCPFYAPRQKVIRIIKPSEINNVLKYIQ